MSDIDFSNITEFKMIKEVILTSTHTNQGRLHLIEFVDEMIRLLNHKNIQTTAKHYAQVLQSTKVKALKSNSKGTKLL